MVVKYEQLYCHLSCAGYHFASIMLLLYIKQEHVLEVQKTTHYSSKSFEKFLGYFL